MNAKTLLLIGASLTMVAAAMPLPLANAHFCQGPAGFCETSTNSCGDGGVHDHTELGVPPFHCTSNVCPHPSPHSHNYGSGGSVGGRSDTATGGDDFGAGVVTVFETNHEDCDGDGVYGDYDGDWETGVGGGFFGYGQWANEPICTYGLTTHGAGVAVTNFGWDVAFVVGADDRDGPAVSTDPVTMETTCSTDGSITPCPDNDPTRCGPTDDPGDCLSEVFVGTGTTCGAGGDGGYWVFLNGAFVTEGAGGVGATNPPTTGTITA